MAVPPAAGVLATMATLLHDLPADRGGALWRLDQDGRQLDANLLRMPPGSRVDGHVEPDLDVLLCVLAGSGSLETGATEQQLVPGCVVWLPRGAHRALRAEQDGLVYVSVHRRRPGLTVRSAAPARTETEPEGGEAACMLSRICPDCDRPAAEADARYCARCGSSLPTS